jgi:hypothetical protein
MYVRVLSFECRADVDQTEVTNVYRTLIAAATQFDGFKGSTLLMSEDACRGMAMVFWQDKESATAAGNTLIDLLNDKIFTMLAHPPDITGYDVVDEELLPSSS